MKSMSQNNNKHTTSKPHYLLLLIALLTLVVFSAIVPPSVFSQEENKKLNMLFISSFPKNIPAQAAFESGLNKVLEYNQGKHNLFFEFMDTPRMSDTNFNGIYAKFLKEKYQGIEFDFLMGWSIKANGFLLMNNGLFPNAKRVYVELMPDLEKNLTGIETVVAVQADYMASMQEILRLENPKQIVVIGTSKDPSSRTRLKRFKNVVSEISPEVEIEYVLDQTINQVISKLATLPKKTLWPSICSCSQMVKEPG
jgi:hypothetical protein